MTLRSLLFIPGDSEKKLAKGDASGADALILDLEDAVAADHKDAARRLVADHLAARPAGQRAGQIWVRVNPLDSGLIDDDLVAVIGAAPDGIMLPKCGGPNDVAALSAKLDRLGAVDTMILPVATETAIAPFRLGEYAGAGLTRLAGLTWGAEDLSADLGASTNRDPDGQWSFTYRLVRSLTLLGAKAAGVQAIDTLYVDFRDEEGLRAASRASRAEGFTGRLAIHPNQVAAINQSYLPSGAEVEAAQRIVAAFAAAEGAGTVGLDGRMLDRPHLRQAEAVIEQAQRG